MAVWILIGEMLLVLALTTALLHKYGDWRRQHLVVSAATLVAWYFSFSIVAILPIDVVQVGEVFKKQYSMKFSQKCFIMRKIVLFLI